MSTNPFPWAEVGLAKMLGVPRGTLRDLRKILQKGVDFEICGKSVQWSEKAAQEAAGHLGASVGAVTPANALLDSPVSKEPAPAHEFMVLKRATNPHMLQCLDKNSAPAWVRVPHNDNFRPRMIIRARHNGNVWELVGRCPRFPGKY